jgi:hypothetical protein
VAGPQGPTGPAGAAGPPLSILGHLPDPASLPAKGTPGDAFFIGPKGALWTWSAEKHAFVWVSDPVKGDTGPRGNMLHVVNPEAIPKGVYAPKLPADIKPGDLIWDSTNHTIWQVTP